MVSSTYAACTSGLSGEERLCFFHISRGLRIRFSCCILSLISSVWSSPTVSLRLANHHESDFGFTTYSIHTFLVRYFILVFPLRAYELVSLFFVYSLRYSCPLSPNAEGSQNSIAAFYFVLQCARRNRRAITPSRNRPTKPTDLRAG
jgi:hypothetical protein